MLRFASRLVRRQVALALVFIIGCASQQPPALQAAIPFPTRETAWLTAKRVPGYPPYDVTEGQPGFFDELRLHSEPGDLAYGMYRLNPGVPQPTVQAVTVTLAAPGDGSPDHQAWIGLADFTTGSWEFSGPYTATQTLPAAQQHVSPQGNVFVVVVTYDFNTAYVAEVSLGLDVAGEMPFADIYSEYPSADVQFNISVTASGSAAAPGRTLTNYEWDLDGDGIYNEAGTEATSEGNVNSTVYGSDVGGKPGVYYPQVRVTDDNAQQATAQMAVTFTGSQLVAVDESFGSNSGEYVSLAVVDGKPAMSYYDALSGDLRYAYSSTAEGGSAADWTWINLDSANDTGKFTSLAVIGGKPAISYYDETTDELMYAYSDSASGADANDWTIVTVDTADGAGARGTSLEEIDGKPAIAYGVREPVTLVQSLRYAYSSSADGSSGWTSLDIDTDENAGGAPSLAVVNGKPAVSYTRNGSVSLFSQLRYALSSADDGSAGWTTVLIFDPPFVGMGGESSLAVVGGKPAISYLNQSGFDGVEYAYSDTADGATAADWHTIVIYSGELPTDSSLAVVNGKPAIAATTMSTDLNLVYLYSATPLGQAPLDWTAMDVDDSFNNTAPGHCSLAEVAGGPGIGYHRSFDPDLYYARPYTGL
jgi:hypothetical protein